MEPENQERLVEQWLDIGLKRYGEAEPRPGLEGRILAGLRAPNKRDGLRRLGSGGRHWRRL